MQRLMHEPDYIVLDIWTSGVECFCQLECLCSTGTRWIPVSCRNLFFASFYRLYRLLDNSFVLGVEQSEVIAGLPTSFLLGRT